MRRLTLLASIVLLISLVPAAVQAQDAGSNDQRDDILLSRSDVAYLLELTRQERAAIEAERLSIQEAVEDPDTIVVSTSRGHVTVPIRRLPSIMQMIAVDDADREVTLDEIALWLRLDTRVELLPSANYFTKAQAQGLDELVAAANEAGERRLDELSELQQAADRFEAWLEEQPVGPDTDEEIATTADDGSRVDVDFASDEGPHTGSCVFTSGYLLRQDDFPVTKVVAWREPDFDPSRARYHYASASLDENAEDPGHRIERMRTNVAADEDANVVFDGSFSGFCAWTQATCPNTSPKQGGTPVCVDGAPNAE